MSSESQKAVVQYMCPECLKVFHYKEQETGIAPKCHYCGTVLEKIDVLR